MTDLNRRQLFLGQKLALECQHALIEAAEANASGGEWLVSDEIGNEYDANLHVDEGLDCPVIELRDKQTNDVRYRFRVEVVCEPIASEPTA